MGFKPGNQVTLNRDKATYDWTTPVFSNEPYEMIGEVTAVYGGKVYVWWNGTNIMDC
jgi:hypothetical protein